MSERVTLREGDFVKVDSKMELYKKIHDAFNQAGFDSGEYPLHANMHWGWMGISNRTKAIFFCDHAEDRGPGNIRELTVDQVLNATNAQPPAQVIEVDKAEWDGEGLPPVGTRCLLGKVDEWTKYGLKVGDEVEIIAHYDNAGINVCAFTFGVPGETMDVDAGRSFRPIKSERDKVIEAALDFIGASRGGIAEADFGRLFDAGYLKMPEV